MRLRLKLKNRQMRMLKRFAKMMKWPNLAETVDNLKRRDADGSLDSISSHAMAFFSGLVLPGVCLSSQPSLSPFIPPTISSDSDD